MPVPSVQRVDISRQCAAFSDLGGTKGRKDPQLFTKENPRRRGRLCERNCRASLGGGHHETLPRGARVAVCPVPQGAARTGRLVTSRNLTAVRPSAAGRTSPRLMCMCQTLLGPPRLSFLGTMRLGRAGRCLTPVGHRSSFYEAPRVRTAVDGAAQQHDREGARRCHAGIWRLVPPPHQRVPPDAPSDTPRPVRREARVAREPTPALYSSATVSALSAK
jgi:hypothetical protein